MTIKSIERKLIISRPPPPRINVNLFTATTSSSFLVAMQQDGALMFFVLRNHFWIQGAASNDC